MPGTVFGQDLVIGGTNSLRADGLAEPVEIAERAVAVLQGDCPPNRAVGIEVGEAWKGELCRGRIDGSVARRSAGVGSGPSVVLVHGAMTTGAQAWAKQQPLADRWQLVIPDRRGYGANPVAERSDFELDAIDIAALLGDGAHPVGHSYGGIVALFAAGRRPDLVRSLTVIEPPAFALRRGDPHVEAAIADHTHLAALSDVEEFYRVFLGHLGARTDNLTFPLPVEVETQVRLVMNERLPWDAPVPVETLRSASFPMLVVSGDHDPVLEMLCDALATAVGPRAERAVIPGRGHVVQRTGTPFNDRLDAFLIQAEQHT